MQPFPALLSCLMLAISATAAPTSQEPITAQTAISDIRGIDDGVQAFRADLKTYDGGALSETPLLADFTAIHLANRKGFADANLRASQFSASDSSAIVQYTIDSVGVDIPAAVEETKAKKADFEKTGQDPVIVGTLQVLLNDHDTFSAALLKKLSADLVRADAVIAKIHNSIQSGIDYFSA